MELILKYLGNEQDESKQPLLELTELHGANLVGYSKCTIRSWIKVVWSAFVAD
jgi:hypothetical protein